MNWTEYDKKVAIAAVEHAEKVGMSPFQAGVKMGIRKIILGQTGLVEKAEKEEYKRKA